jgi:hypothetical protein
MCRKSRIGAINKGLRMNIAMTTPHAYTNPSKRVAAQEILSNVVPYIKIVLSRMVSLNCVETLRRWLGITVLLRNVGGPIGNPQGRELKPLGH